MLQTTDVNSNSIQNKRVTESGKPLDVNKAFSYYIQGLKQEEDCGKLPKIDEEEYVYHKIVATDRVEALGDVPSFSEQQNFYTLTQTWLGTVTEMTEGGFVARLEDLDQGGTHEIAEFFNEEISRDDLSLKNVGAVFYWSLGYANTKGSVEKKSMIRFQRLPKWTESDFDTALDKANAQAKVTKWL